MPRIATLNIRSCRELSKFSSVKTAFVLPLTMDRRYLINRPCLCTWGPCAKLSSTYRRESCYVLQRRAVTCGGFIIRTSRR